MAELRRNPPGRRQQFRHGRQARKIIGTLLLYAKSFKNRRTMENLIFAHTILQIHFKQFSLEWPDEDDLPFVLYATWYLNDNEPEVFGEDQDETS